jgi:hypothetical protein
MVGEVEGDMDLGMTIVGKIVVVERPKILGKVGVGQLERMVPAIGEPAEIHVTEGVRLDDRDGLIIEGLDLGFGNIKLEDERV